MLLHRLLTTKLAILHAFWASLLVQVTYSHTQSCNRSATAKPLLIVVTL
jgi:hypothetical protein